ncbi:MAG: zinc-ribbon domain-containing protein [Verrucomicrobia bacterium]|nr:zinc-ribbon domain-containing protein [Verrucomicrobiota bacterium]MBU1909940.1 zinc-ribbon domain-containing protein [Verrucomicrobiota bacterium]
MSDNRTAGEPAPTMPGTHALVLLLCLHEELGRAFLAAVAPRTSGNEGEVEIEGHRVHLRILSGDPQLTPGWDEAVRHAHGCVLLVRFLDIVSLDRIRAIYRRLPAERSAPLAILFFRQEGEMDFKISCPSCGQKLWVRDSDGGKRGRCPNCQKGFRLPSQAGFLRSQLALPDSVATLTVVNGRPASCRGALAHLIGLLGGAIVGVTSLDHETLKKSTVRVELQDSDSTAHD